MFGNSAPRSVTGNLLGAALLAALLVAGLLAQTDWPQYGHDPGGERYSPLKQITTDNVSKLKPAWTWDPGESSLSFETTPLVIGNVMYVSTPRERVVALDADTGKELWSFDTRVTSPSTHRGVSYWPGDAQTQTQPRIIAGTSDGRLFALDAKTGQPASSFGDNGLVNLRAAFADKFPTALYGISSPPAIYRNLLIFGPRTQESGAKGPSSEIRALDARTGKQVWSFHTLPQPNEPGYETWGPEFWKDGAGPSAWAQITVDTARGMVFVPVGNPSGGGDPAGRKGKNLYSNSVIALNADTGKLIWYYQLVHHDVWDYDVTAPPALVDVVQNGKKIPAVAQLTKQGLLFILDRMTGQPVFGAEEREVPKNPQPGEELWPTQPFPLKPVALARNSMSAAEISRITPESEKFCAALVADHETGGPFPARGGASITFPSSIGGGNWGGVSFDAGLGLIFVNTSNLGSVSNVRRPVAPAPGAPVAGAIAASGAAGRGNIAGNNGGGGGGSRFVDQDHYPCNQPPWGQLTAINANTGDVAWQVTLGGYKQLEEKGIKNAGAVNTGGSMVTGGGVLFIGATNDHRFRAFDARTGKQLWQIDMDGNALASPITYLGRNGKQIIAVITGGSSYMGGVGPQDPMLPGKITAFTLPQ
jgi:glucose dehydrogenase